MMSSGGNPTRSTRIPYARGADLELAFGGIGLAPLVEGHDDRRRAVAPDQSGLADERLFAFLEADRIDDALALNAFEPGLDDRPVGRVDHHGHPAYVRFGGDQVEEPDHRRFRIEQPLVHVDVDDLGAVLDLLAGDVERRFEVALPDEPGEPRGARDVGPLSHVDEQGGGFDGEGLETAQAAHRRAARGRAGGQAGDRVGDGFDMRRGGPAAAAHQVDEAGLGELPQYRPHLFRRLVVSAEGVGKAGVGVAADEGLAAARDLLDMRTQSAPRRARS